MKTKRPARTGTPTPTPIPMPSLVLELEGEGVLLGLAEAAALDAAEGAATVEVELAGVLDAGVDAVTVTWTVVAIGTGTVEVPRLLSGAAEVSVLDVDPTNSADDGMDATATYVEVGV